MRNSIILVDSTTIKFNFKSIIFVANRTNI
nr:MAG TPA: hypothetical protein [Caudoviricetes sp.]